MGTTRNAPLDRVAERQRAAALARHYREAEGLSIAKIAERLGRAHATVKGYFYDPSEANIRPADSPPRSGDIAIRALSASMWSDRCRCG